MEHSTSSSQLLSVQLPQEEDPDLENEELVVREPEDDDGECRARQRSEERARMGSRG